MGNLNKQSIKNLTQLSRIQCSEEEQESLLKDLEKILAYFEELQEIDTNDVAACNQVLEQNDNVVREDKIGKLLPRDVFLENVPSQIGGLVRVPPVMKSS